MVTELRNPTRLLVHSSVKVRGDQADDLARLSESWLTDAGQSPTSSFPRAWYALDGRQAILRGDLRWGFITHGRVLPGGIRRPQPLRRGAKLRTGHQSTVLLRRPPGRSADGHRRPGDHRLERHAAKHGQQQPGPDSIPVD